MLLQIYNPPCFDRLLHRDHARRVPLALRVLQARRAGHDPKPTRIPEEYRADVWPLWFVAFAFLHNRRFGPLFVLGLAVEAALRLAG